MIDAIIDVSHAVTMWSTANAQYAALLKIYAAYQAGSAPPEDRYTHATAAQNHDMEKHRPALADAHKALELATLLCHNSTEFLPMHNRTLISTQLDRIAKALLNAQKLVMTMEVETPQEIVAATTRFRVARGEVVKLAGDLVKLMDEIVVKPENEEKPEVPPPPESPPPRRGLKCRRRREAAD